MRHRQVFGLAELNEYIGELLERLNTRAFQKLPGYWRELFGSLDRPAMRPLPPRPYEYAEWKKVRVNVDYHVEVDRHYYSVPYQLIGKQLDARITANTVELLHKGRRVASHPRSWRRTSHTTVPEHMPESHREQVKWTPQRLIRWAARTGLPTRRTGPAVPATRTSAGIGARAPPPCRTTWFPAATTLRQSRIRTTRRHRPSADSGRTLFSPSCRDRPRS